MPSVLVITVFRITSIQFLFSFGDSGGEGTGCVCGGNPRGAPIPLYEQLLIVLLSGICALLSIPS